MSVCLSLVLQSIDGKEEQSTEFARARGCAQQLLGVLKREKAHLIQSGQLTRKVVVESRRCGLNPARRSRRLSLSCCAGSLCQMVSPSTRRQQRMTHCDWTYRLSKSAQATQARIDFPAGMSRR